MRHIDVRTNQIVHTKRCVISMYVPTKSCTPFFARDWAMAVSGDANAMPEECPVCFCALRGDVCGLVTDNSLSCANGHKVCTDCVRRLVVPDNTTETGFSYRCPVCREESGLSRLHVMVLIYGTWGRAQEQFRSEREVRQWTAGDRVETE